MDNFEHREKPPITKEEREAKKERARQEAEIALAARKKEDEAFRANFERLKAERMAREASETNIIAQRCAPVVSRGWTYPS